MSEAVGNLLYDSVSRNTGDIAIGIASAQLLGSRGIRSQIVNPFDEITSRPLVIGGGELIREKGDLFYDAFRQPGRHILNAAGVWSSASDLDYLNGYSYVSARSERELGFLQKWVPTAEVVPCATTELHSEHFPIAGIEQGEVLVGIHLVPHALRLIEDLIPIIDAIPHKKVFIPFTHYNGDASFMKTLPFDKTNSIMLDELKPLELHSVISQMSYVVVSSLHASIFAYSQNVPFASVHQKKAEYYFADRGLDNHLVRDQRELIGLLDRLDSESFDFSPLIATDKSRVEAAFDRYAATLHDDDDAVPAADSFPVRARREDIVMLDQAQMVISDRDLALSYSESRRLALRKTAAQLEGQIASALAEAGQVNEKVLLMERQLAAADAEISRYRDEWWRRMVQTFRRALNRFAAVFKRT